MSSDNNLGTWIVCAALFLGGALLGGWSCWSVRGVQEASQFESRLNQSVSSILTPEASNAFKAVLLLEANPDQQRTVQAAFHHQKPTVFSAPPKGVQIAQGGNSDVRGN